MTLDAFLLADGRFPAGGHVHSAGVEAAVADGRVHDDGRRSRRTCTAASSPRVSPTPPSRSRPTTRDRAPPTSGTSARSCCSRSTPKPTPASRHRRSARRRAGSGANSCAPRRRVLAVDRAVRRRRRCCPTAPTSRARSGSSAARRAWRRTRSRALAVHHAIATPGQAGVRLLGLDPFAVVALAAAARRRR